MYLIYKFSVVTLVTPHRINKAENKTGKKPNFPVTSKKKYYFSVRSVNVATW